MKKKETKKKILKAALKEFSQNGFKGGRVDIIAREAGINKAMIFYYYTSKEELFKQVLKDALKEIFFEVAKKLFLKPTVNNLVEKLPEIHIQFLLKNPDFVRMVGLNLLQNPELIKKFIRQEFSEKLPFSSDFILNKIKKAYEKGKITESDPLQFLINVVSLNIFIFIGKPIIEAIFDIKIDQIDNFYQKRVESIKNIIKQGMMK